MNKQYLFLHQIVLRWKSIILCALAIILLLGFLIAKLGIAKRRLEEEYLVAKGAFKKWEQSLDEKWDHLRQLQESLKKHPELQAQYDPCIAQFFLAMTAPEQGTPLIERTLKRTQQPYYSVYGRTSLKISQKKYQEALEDSLALKEKIEENRPFGATSNQHSLLFAFNLLRIALLHQQLGHTKQELETWQQIEHYGGWKQGESLNKSIENKGFKELLNHFTVGQTTLVDYIIKREKELENL